MPAETSDLKVGRHMNQIWCFLKVIDIDFRELQRLLRQIAGMIDDIQFMNNAQKYVVLNQIYYDSRDSSVIKSIHHKSSHIVRNYIAIRAIALSKSSLRNSIAIQHLS